VASSWLGDVRFEDVDPINVTCIQ